MLYFSSNEMVVKRNMFHPRVKDRVGTKKCGTKVITVDDWWSLEGDAELT